MSAVKIEVFSSPGCSKCKKAIQEIIRLLKEMGDPGWEIKEVNVLENLEYAVQSGVVTTPSIAINGKIVFQGLPSRKALQDLLYRLQEGKE